jgi:hypothetical protein
MWNRGNRVRCSRRKAQGARRKALEAVSAERTMSRLAATCEAHPPMIHQWKEGLSVRRGRDSIPPAIFAEVPAHHGLFLA